jgi:choline-glycine betaine transporter
MTPIDPAPRPRELALAARIVTLVAYAAALTGVAIGAGALREGAVVRAAAAFALTFALGTALVALTVLLRAVTGLTLRMTRLEDDLAALSRRWVSDPER